MGDAQAGAGIMYEVIMPDVVKPNSFWEHGHWDNKDQCLKIKIKYKCHCLMNIWLYIYVSLVKLINNQPFQFLVES